MAETLSIISIVSFVLSGICLVLAVFAWFYFEIPTIIGDLSGRTARKSIAQMREFNEKSGNKSYKPSGANVERGKLTDTMQHSRKLKNNKKKETASDEIPETGLLDENKAQSVDAGEQTALLVDEQATGLLAGENETELLGVAPAPKVKRTGGKQITLLEEVVLIHTDEVIG